MNFGDSRLNRDRITGPNLRFEVSSTDAMASTEGNPIWGFGGLVHSLVQGQNRVMGSGGKALQKLKVLQLFNVQ